MNRILHLQLNFFLTCLLLTVAGASPVVPLRAATDGGFKFRHITIDQGLPSNWVGALLQDRDGLVWVGTSYGLCSYDGMNFRHIAGSGNTSGVFALHETDEGIWAGRDNGLFRYDRASDSLMQENPVTGNGMRITSQVNWIGSDRQQNIWLSTFGQGIFRYTPSTRSLRQYLLPGHGTQVAGMLVDADGQIWAIGKAAQNDGIVRLNRATDQFECVPVFDQHGNPVDTRGLALLQGSDGTIWVGTWDNGVVGFDPHTSRVIDRITPQQRPLSHIHSLLEYAPGIICIGSDDGLTRYDSRSHKLHHFVPDELDRHSLNDQFVYPLMRDQEGGLWVGTYYGGLNYANPQSEVFRTYLPSAFNNSIHGNIISCFCEDGDGNIWIGSDDGGLSCFRNGIFTHSEGEKSRNIHALCLHDGELWIGTYTGGVDVMNLSNGRVRHFAELLDPYDNSLGNSCYAIFNDRQNRLWVGTYTGLCLYDDKSGLFISRQDFGATPYSICQDRQDNIWCSTDGNGIWRMDAKSGDWKQYRDASGKNVNNTVNSVCCDSEGRLWVGSQDGLLRFDAEANVFGLVERLGDFPDVQSVVADGNALWVATTRALIRYMPDLHDSVQVFTSGNGLNSTSYQPDAILCASDGRICLGTTQGMQTFYPSRIRLNRVAPRVIFTGLDLGPNDADGDMADRQFRQMRASRQIELGHRYNSIGISFAALSYACPSQNQYAIWLEGFNSDGQWQHIGNQNWVNYTNLAPGTYVLHVRAANNDNVWSAADAELRIIVHPPFYWTTTARVVYVLLALLVIGLLLWLMLHRNNIRHLQEMENLRHQNEQRLHEARMRFFTTIAHEIRTPVSLIIAPLEKVRRQSAMFSSSVNEDLAVVERNSRRLLELVNQLLDFRKVESGMTDLVLQPCAAAPLLQSIAERFRPSFEERGIALQVALPDADFSPCIDREAITKMVSNLLSNALKYTRDRVLLSCKVLPDVQQWLISVTDNGPGIRAEERKKVFQPFYQANENKPGTGIGLSIVKAVVEAHRGTVSIESEPDSGTTFTVSLPADLPASAALVTGEAKAVPDVPASSAETMSAQPAAEPAEGYEKAWTLLVDDNDDMLHFLSDSMKPYYNLLTATDGAQALRLLEKHQVSLIVSDWMMPVMDGEELCRRVRNNPQTSHIPFIMLTAKTDDASKVRGMDCGADAYIEKTFSLDYLQACIGNLLELRRMLWRRFSQQSSTPITEMAGSPLDSDLLLRMERIIEENLANSDLSVDLLAQELGISRSGLFAKIKTLSDVSPNEMIQAIRLKKAAALLSKGGHRISEVCYMVGFSSPSYFSKCFQRQFGVKPGEYQQPTE